AGQPDLWDVAVSLPLPDRLPLHGAGFHRPAARRAVRCRRRGSRARASGVMNAKVAVLRVTPETILTDIDRLVDLAGVSSALAPGKPTIFKENISLHFPFPAANT